MVYVNGDDDFVGGVDFDMIFMMVMMKKTIMSIS